MSTAALNRYTPEEYLALERNAEFKSEYIDGRIVAMTGAQRPHTMIVHNLDRELGNALRDNPCEVYPADMRVKITPSGRYVYPDLSVACDPKFEDAEVDTLLNPVVIIEVLSESTKHYDRGEKFQHYRKIQSLREYVLVTPDQCMVEQHVRDGDVWRYESITDLDGFLVLASMGVSIPLREIYAKLLPRKDGLAEGNTV